MSLVDFLRAWLSGARTSVAPAVLPQPTVRYQRGTCHRCGRPDVALRADGLPHARRHRCEVVERPPDAA